MPGHTVTEMLDILALRLEDASATKFSVAIRLDALNKAQLRLTNLVHPRLLTELEVREFANSCAVDTGDDEGSYPFTSLADWPLADGIKMVRINGGGAYCHEIELKDIKKLGISFNTPTDARPYFYIDRERIYVAASSDTTSIDIWYLRVPKDMVAQFTCDAMDTAVADITAPDLDARHCVMSFGTPGWTADEFVGMTGYNETQSAHFIVYDNDTGALSLIYYDTDVTFASGDVIHFTSSAATQDSLTSASCELNPSLHDYVVDLAESRLWTHDGELERSQKVYQQAVGEIQFMNSKYGLERNIGFADRGAPA